MAKDVSSPAPTFKITIIADTICAWCYINHVRLSKAIHLYSKTYNSQDTFSITYKPYLLQPQLSKQSVPVAEKFQERFGQDRAATIQRMMDRVAQADGIKFSRQGRVGDSRASHCVIAEVGRHGLLGSQKDVVGEIMKRYYEEDGDITDTEMLFDCAVKIGGMKRDVLEAAIENDHLAAYIEKEASSARDRGINGVPHLDINGTIIEGARDVEELFQGLIEIKEKQRLEVIVDESYRKDQCSNGFCM